MIPTKTDPGPFDAFDKALADEPIFTLLGRDPASPSAITEWCRVRRNLAIKNCAARSDEMTDELRQCAEAEVIAFAMEDYRSGAEAGVPQETVATNYSGAQGESHEQRARNLLVADTVAHLRAAAYHVNEACERLGELGIDSLAIHKANHKPGLPVFELCDALAAIKDADEAVAPKRREVQTAADLPAPIPPSFEATA